MNSRFDYTNNGRKPDIKITNENLTTNLKDIDTNVVCFVVLSMMWDENGMYDSNGTINMSILQL